MMVDQHFKNSFCKFERNNPNSADTVLNNNPPVIAGTISCLLCCTAANEPIKIMISIYIKILTNGALLQKKTRQDPTIEQNIETSFIGNML